MNKMTGIPNQTLLSIMASVIPSHEQYPISLLTGYEVNAQLKLEEAVKAMSDLSLLLEVSDHCLTMEGAAKDASMEHFKLLSGMDYTEEGVGDVIAATKKLVAKAIENVKYFFTDYLAEAIRGNKSRIEKLKQMKEELSKLSIEVIPTMEVPWNRIMILGDNILDDTNNIADIFRATGHFAAACASTSKILTKLLTDGEKYDYAELQKELTSYVILRGDKSVLYQKTYVIGFYNDANELENEDVMVYPKNIAENGPRVSWSSYEDLKIKTLIGNIDAWIKEIEYQEAAFKKVDVVATNYTAMAAAINKSDDKAFIKRAQKDMSAHVSFTKRVISFNQDSISEMVSLLLLFGNNAKKLDKKQAK